VLVCWENGCIAGLRRYSGNRHKPANWRVANKLRSVGSPAEARVVADQDEENYNRIGKKKSKIIMLPYRR
jgi:hypothetical protein